MLDNQDELKIFTMIEHTFNRHMGALWLLITVSFVVVISLLGLIYQEVKGIERQTKPVSQETQQ